MQEAEPSPAPLPIEGAPQPISTGEAPVRPSPEDLAIAAGHEAEIDQGLAAQPAETPEVTMVEQVPAMVQQHVEHTDVQLIGMRQILRAQLERERDMLDYQIPQVERRHEHAEDWTRSGILRTDAINRRGVMSPGAANAMRDVRMMEVQGNYGRLQAIDQELQALRNRRNDVQSQIDALIAADRAGMPDTMINPLMAEQIDVQAQRFAPSNGPEVQFNLAEGLLLLEPSLADRIRALPPNVQAPLTLSILDMQMNMERQRAFGETLPVLEQMLAIPALSDYFFNFIETHGQLPTNDNSNLGTHAENHRGVVNILEDLIAEQQPDFYTAMYGMRVHTRRIELAVDQQMQSAEQSERIKGLVERLQSAETEQEQARAEGFLMMEGVDIEASNFDSGSIVVLPENERGPLFFMGLMKVLQSFVLDDEALPVAIDATDVEGTIPDQIATNDKLLKEMEARKTTLVEEMEKLKTQIDSTPPGEERDGLQTQWDTMEEDRKKLETDIADLEAFQETLRQKAETETEAPATSEEDTQFREAFLSRKDALLSLLHERIGDDVQYRERIDALYSVLDIEKNPDTGQYRFVVDPTTINGKFPDNLPSLESFAEANTVSLGAGTFNTIDEQTGKLATEWIDAPVMMDLLKKEGLL